MNTKLNTLLIGLGLSILSTQAFAASVTIPNTFTAVKTAVDDISSGRKILKIKPLYIVIRGGSKDFNIALASCGSLSSEDNPYLYLAETSELAVDEQEKNRRKFNEYRITSWAIT